MNNITWGDNKATSYYETVAGGAGAVSNLSFYDCINAKSFTIPLWI